MIECNEEKMNLKVTGLSETDRVWQGSYSTLR